MKIINKCSYIHFSGISVNVTASFVALFYFHFVLRINLKNVSFYILVPIGKFLSKFQREDQNYVFPLLPLSMEFLE